MNSEPNTPTALDQPQIARRDFATYGALAAVAALMPGTRSGGGTAMLTPPPRARVVWGLVRRDRTPINGSKNANNEFNFEVEPKQREGNYVIGFDPAFNNPPGVIVQHVFAIGDSSNIGGGGLDNATVEGIDNKHVSIQTCAFNGQVTDRDFAFVAFGYP